MKTLTTPITDNAASKQAAWVEVYDFYLGSTVTTPFGETDVLRLTPCPGGFQFFTPLLDPEPTGTQGDAQTYQFWPVKRGTITDQTRMENSVLNVFASNTTKEWASVVDLIDWERVKLVIRKTKLTNAGLVAADCSVLFNGGGLRAEIDDETNQVNMQFTHGNGLFEEQLPADNMHPSCRFEFGDDYCGQLKFRVENYSAKMCGEDCTTTNLLSADLGEDSGAADGAEGTDEVDALDDSAITASSEALGVYLNEPVAITKFQLGGRFPPPPVVVVENGQSYLFTSGARIKFSAGVMPGNLVSGTWYRIWPKYSAWILYPDSQTTEPVTLADAIVWTSNGSAVLMTTEVAVGPASSVRVSNDGFFWKFSVAADWGDATQGYYQIPDAQAGLANALLKPYITFDFGIARALRLWRIMTVGEFGREGLVRQLVFFSSPDGETWNFETYFECPPVGDQYFEALLHGARSARYWRICVRSRWSETLQFSLLKKVRAYEGSRDWWRNGWITFLPDTPTVALRGVVANVRQSYAGRIVTSTLPVAPAAGDQFRIERGCGKEWNDCCARQNHRQFGGFNTIPTEQVAR